MFENRKYLVSVGTGEATAPTTGHTGKHWATPMGGQQPSPAAGEAKGLLDTIYPPFSVSHHYPTGMPHPHQSQSLHWPTGHIVWGLGHRNYLGQVGRQGFGTGPSVNHTQSSQEHQRQAAATQQKRTHVITP